MRWSIVSVCVTAGVALLCAQPAPRDAMEQLRAAFAKPPDDSRIMMRWWWFGPAVEKPELERELRAMKEGGVGGVEIQPVYPLTLDDPAHGLVNQPYLSDAFLDGVRFANDKARELGMRVDITLGSGWPYGGPHTSADLGAGRLRVERVTVPANATSAPLPKMGAEEKFLAAFFGDGPPLGADDAGLHFPASDTERAALIFIASHTRQGVKRAAVGAEGLVLDHYSQPAIENHLHFVGDRLMQAFGAHPPYAVFSDSLEVYGSDWTGDLLSEFAKRRGYDLKPHLAALVGERSDETAAVRHDWGRTLTELANEHYLTPLRQWAAAHGTRFRSQNYGIPPVNLSSNALVDLPEGEGSQWRRFTPTRWATSAGHLYGRPVISSECWTWLHSPVFRATPLDMKAEADLHFLEGVNQLVGHGWPYSPPQAGEPGWHFYAAAVFNQHNPWWIAMPDITAYLQRVSWLLRQGEPVNDVALYLPTDDAYAEFTPGRDSVNQTLERLLGPNVIPQILDAGYNFDFIDDEAIAAGGMQHPVLVLPNVERIPIETLEKIAEFAGKGGVVIATGRIPSLAPGWREAASESPKIRALARSLFESAGASGHWLRDDAKLGETLRAVSTPDLTAPAEIGFVHRKLAGAHVYFIANTTNHRVRGQLGFRDGRIAENWDPFTGETAAMDDPAEARDLDLAPYESRIYVCMPQPNAAAGSARAMKAAPVELADLSMGWKVTFPGSAQPVAMEKLIPWIEVAGMKNFSGTATYERVVSIDDRRLQAAHRLYLDFGEGTPVTATEHRSGNGMRAMLESPVREAAVVYVNGKRAGSVWHPPYQVEITALLHGGENTLRIAVANLALNEMAAQPRADYRELIAKFGNRFQDQDMQDVVPLPAGILGPVRIVGR